MAEIDKLLKFLVDHEGTDLLLATGCHPVVRIHGDLYPITFGDDHETLSIQATKALVYRLMTDSQMRVFEETGDLDMSYELLDVARFRINVYKQAHGVAALFRVIPTSIRTIEELGMPEGVHMLAQAERGFILCTGPTGCGKTTTLAAIIDQINRERQCHILTIEEPIEYVHRNINCLITQREVGPHTESFASALKVAQREDPDIILVGEMRDLETISMALTVAETGVLVFGTLHTNSATKTINRIIDVFPFAERSQIRTLLAESLTGVISQQLLKRADGSGRVAAAEVLIGTSAIASAIREGKIEQMSSLMETGKKFGMYMMDDHLMELVEACVITPESAREKAVNKTLFR